MEGQWKFLVGVGVLKAKIIEAKYEAKLDFVGVMGVQNKKTFRGGSMNIFWNNTMLGARKLKQLYCMLKHVLRLHRQLI